MVTSPIIAIVDDDPGVRGSLDSLLRSAGLTSLAFDSAKAMLAFGTQDQISLVVTDLHMPGLTGLELLAEMTRLGWRHPTIVMTAYPTEAARRQALASGAVAFVSKPIDPVNLLSAISAAIN